MHFVEYSVTPFFTEYPQATASGFSLTDIFPYKDQIVDSVLIREYKGQKTRILACFTRCLEKTSAMVFFMKKVGGYQFLIIFAKTLHRRYLTDF